MLDVNYLLVIVTLFMFIFSFLDIKYRLIPSVFTTSLLFIVLVLRLDNLEYGILALIFSVFIYELWSGMYGKDFGLADMKVMVIIGLLISDMRMFFVFIGLFMLFQFIYAVLWSKFVKSENLMPFIPCLYAVYLTLLMLGGFS